MNGGKYVLCLSPLLFVKMPSTCLVIAILLTAMANLLLKLSAAAEPTEWVITRRLPPSFLPASAVVLLALALLAYHASLSRFPVTVAYPVMTSSVMVLVSAGAVLWLGESMNVASTVGVALILVGIALICI